MNGGRKIMFEGKRVLVTGGTGSLGKLLVRRLLSAEQGTPKQVIVLSRDEAKQHDMRLEYMKMAAATDDVIYNNFKNLLSFRIGDVRDFHTVTAVLREADIVLNAAALKQVPTCEYFPYEAVETNISGAENIVRAIRENNLDVDTVVGVSTDKACKPVNVMGMTKAVQERIFLTGNLYCPNTRFICVRYGNVLASRGSVVPFFHEQVRNGGPVTITTIDMTRYLLSLNRAVDTIFSALSHLASGETLIPRVPSARITDLAECLIGDRPIETTITGIRPGEKVHEVLVSEEEASRTYTLNDDYYVIRSILPELCTDKEDKPILGTEYSSQDGLLSRDGVMSLLTEHHLLVEDNVDRTTELLR
jgi:FlaA1/EpsC-like NDP-sugar epimerase